MRRKSAGRMSPPLSGRRHGASGTRFEAGLRRLAAHAPGGAMRRRTHHQANQVEKSVLPAMSPQ